MEVSFYSFLLALHSWLRWIVLLAAVIAIFRNFRGWFGKREWNAFDTNMSTWLAMLISIQFVLGILLLFVSPNIHAAFAQGMGAIMKDSHMRMMVIEHPLTMTISLALVHIGKARARRAPTDLAKHKTAAIFFTISLLLILSRVPWGDVPMFRGF